MRRSRVIIALGANVGNAPLQLTQAFAALCSLAEASEPMCSPQVWTKAVLHPDNPTPQPDYCNQVVRIETRQHPELLLTHAKRLERRAGRNEGDPRWSPRTLDIDIIDYACIYYASNRLLLPHPEAARRWFVLEGWAAIDPQNKMLMSLLKKNNRSP